MRISSPPVTHPCFLRHRIDNQAALIAAANTLERSPRNLGVDPWPNLKPGRHARGRPRNKAATSAPPASMAINPIPMDDSIRSSNAACSNRPVIGGHGLEQPTPV